MSEVTTHAWHVLGRRSEGSNLEVVGLLHAPDAEAALLLARETHFRHGEGVDYAVVREDHLVGLDDRARLSWSFDHSFRLQQGFTGLGSRREVARAAAERRGHAELRARPVPGDAGGGAAA